MYTTRHSRHCAYSKQGRFKMSNLTESSCSSDSWSETESSCDSSEYFTANSGESESEFLPYDDNIEPLASPEEIAQYEQVVAEEQHNENVLQQRFNAEIEVASW